MLPYVKVFPDLNEPVQAMDDSMAGRLFKAILEYANGGDPMPEGAEKFVYLMLRAQFQRDREDYERTRAANSQNGAKGGRPQKPKKATAFSENPSLFSVSEKSEKSQEEEKEEEKEKEEEEEYIYTTGGGSTRARVERDELCAYIAQSITPMNADIMDGLLSFRDSLPEELIRYAVQETLSCGNRSAKYLKSILNRWAAAGYKTIAEVEAADEKRKLTQAAPKNAQPFKPGKTMLTRGTPIADDEDAEMDRLMGRRTGS